MSDSTKKICLGYPRNSSEFFRPEANPYENKNRYRKKTNRYMTRMSQ
jgi:hypothetical protein